MLVDGDGDRSQIWTEDNADSLDIFDAVSLTVSEIDNSNDINIGFVGATGRKGIRRIYHLIGP